MTTTVWHITFGTYGARLHGGDRPTVARPNNHLGDPYVLGDRPREDREASLMKHPLVSFTKAEQRLIESLIPAICKRGGWSLLTCAAAPDHVHVLVAAPSEIHGKQIRALLKRWLTQTLADTIEVPRRPDGMRFWAEGGSNRAVKGDAYLARATRYVEEQRATPP